MKKLFLISLLSAGLVAAPMAMAQSPAKPAQAECSAGQKSCATQSGKAQSGKSTGKTETKGNAKSATKSNDKSQGKSATKTSAKPKVGGSAKGGKAFQQGKNSRFSNPPKGQEYRVVDDYLVLADKNTLKVISVVGLLASLTK